MTARSNVFGIVFAGSLLVLPKPANAAVKKMFVTSATGTGNLGSWPEAAGETGAAAANQICRTLATNAGLDDAGNYRAWISTPVTDAYCRVAGFTGKRETKCGQADLPDAGPWVRTDDKAFTTGLKDLTNHAMLLHPPRLDELGNTVPPTLLFTGTYSDGSHDLDHDCGAWTEGTAGDQGLVGDPTSATYWSAYYSSDCDEPGRLICFDPGSGDLYPDFEKPGAYAFVTSEEGTGSLHNWPEAGSAGGIGAGDAICRSLAAAAGLPAPNTFIAWLSTSGIEALDRLPTGTPFKRIDGVRIALNRSELAVDNPDSLTLRAALNLTETGQYVADLVWTGTASTGAGTGSDCDNWTRLTADFTAEHGFTSDTRGWWTESEPFFSNLCSATHRLYCFSTVVTIFYDGFETGELSRWSNL